MKHDISRPMTIKEAREYIAYVTDTNPNPKKNRLIRRKRLRAALSKQESVKLLGPNRLKPPKPIESPFLSEYMNSL